LAVDQPQAVEQVGPVEAALLLDDGAALIDVREPEEWQAGRAPQAVHIPLGQLGERLDELPQSRKLVMICRSGGRSGVAATALVEMGLPALNLAGGMQAWKAAALPVVKDGGEPGEVA
jgi:rhodanese-related sulfurtransferase